MMFEGLLKVCFWQLLRFVGTVNVTAGGNRRTVLARSHENDGWSPRRPSNRATQAEGQRQARGRQAAGGVRAESFPTSLFSCPLATAVHAFNVEEQSAQKHATI